MMTEHDLSERQTQHEERLAKFLKAESKDKEVATAKHERDKALAEETIASMRQIRDGWTQEKMEDIQVRERYRAGAEARLEAREKLLEAGVVASGLEEGEKAPVAGGAKKGKKK